MIFFNHWYQSYSLYKTKWAKIKLASSSAHVSQIEIICLANIGICWQFCWPDVDKQRWLDVILLILIVNGCLDVGPTPLAQQALRMPT